MSRFARFWVKTAHLEDELVELEEQDDVVEAADVSDERFSPGRDQEVFGHDEVAEHGRDELEDEEDERQLERPALVA